MLLFFWSIFSTITKTGWSMWTFLETTYPTLGFYNYIQQMQVASAGSQCGTTLWSRRSFEHPVRDWYQLLIFAFAFSSLLPFQVWNAFLLHLSRDPDQSCILCYCFHFYCKDFCSWSKKKKKLTTQSSCIHNKTPGKRNSSLISAALKNLRF